jgi:hypothetical protein
VIFIFQIFLFWSYAQILMRFMFYILFAFLEPVSVSNISMSAEPPMQDTDTVHTIRSPPKRFFKYAYIMPPTMPTMDDILHGWKLAYYHQGRYLKLITTLKWSTGRPFTAATQHLTPPVVLSLKLYTTVNLSL